MAVGQNWPGGSESKESACSAEDLGSVPGLGRSPGGGNSYPLQYSSLENSMDCIVHGGHKELDTTETFTSFQGFVNAWTLYMGKAGFSNLKAAPPPKRAKGTGCWKQKQITARGHTHSRI